MKENWKGFLTETVNIGTFPDSKTAKEKYNIPFGKWFELSVRYSNLPKEACVNSAKKVLAECERGERK